MLTNGTYREVIKLYINAQYVSSMLSVICVACKRISDNMSINTLNYNGKNIKKMFDD